MPFFNVAIIWSRQQVWVRLAGHTHLPLVDSLDEQSASLIPFSKLNASKTMLFWAFPPSLSH
jgi:hypothetical protein